MKLFVTLRFLTAICAGLAIATGWPSAASAHPLGNNTVSRQAHLSFDAQRMGLTYRMDFAEIPTLAAGDEADTDGDGTTSEAEWQAYAQRWCDQLSESLQLRLGTQAIHLSPTPVRHELRNGEAGLPVLRLEAQFTAALPAGGRFAVNYADRFRPRDMGWKEIWVSAGSNVSVDGSVARTDRSTQLTHYPKDGAMPQELSSQFALALPFSAGSAPLEADSAPAPHTVQATTTARPHSLSAYFLLGMHHIATGWDHLAFLLGLLLLTPGRREIIKLVTAFTIAHSITLLLAAGHLVTPPGTWVEPAIAATIAYVGAVALLRRAAGHGMALAFGFGLIHGFGFAGALAETLGNATRESGWLLKLLAFNLGIEAFQIALVLLALLLAMRLRAVRWRASAHAAASFAVLSCGLTWLLLRLLP